MNIRVFIRSISAFIISNSVAIRFENNNNRQLSLSDRDAYFAEKDKYIRNPRISQDINLVQDIFITITCLKMPIPLKDIFKYSFIRAKAREFTSVYIKDRSYLYLPKEYGIYVLDHLKKCGEISGLREDLEKECRSCYMKILEGLIKTDVIDYKLMKSALVCLSNAYRSIIDKTILTVYTNENKEIPDEVRIIDEKSFIDPFDFNEFNKLTSDV